MSGFEAVIPYVVAAGAAVSAVSAVESADTSRKQQHTKADIDRANALEASRQAIQAIESQRAKARSVIGAQLASTSESGTGLSGSNLDLLNESLMNNELDSLSIRYGAQRNANALNAQADLDDMGADASTTGGYLTAAGALLNGYGQTYTAQRTLRGYSYTGDAGGSTFSSSGDAIRYRH